MRQGEIGCLPHAALGHLRRAPRAVAERTLLHCFATSTASSVDDDSILAKKNVSFWHRSRSIDKLSHLRLISQALRRAVLVDLGSRNMDGKSSQQVWEHADERNEA